MSADEGEVEPYTQGWTLASEGHCLVASRFIYHETGRRQDAIAVSAYHRFIDAGGPAKIVSVDD